MIAVTLAALLSSCKKEPSVNFQTERLDVPSAGGQFEVTMSANYDWQAASDCSWMSVSTKTGEAGSSVLKINVSPNTQPDQRSGNLVITCQELVQTFPVVQAPKDMVAISDGNTLTLSSDAQTLSVKIGYNVDYDVTSDSPWLRVQSTKSLTEGCVNFVVEENPFTSTRKATVLFLNSSKGVDTRLEITQSGKPQTFRLVHERQSFPIPSVFGFGSTISVDWGDGVSEDYSSSLVHEYSGESKHTITISAQNASTLSVTDLTGVTELDFSRF